MPPVRLAKHSYTVMKVEISEGLEEGRDNPLACRRSAARAQVSVRHVSVPTCHSMPIST